MSDAIKRLNSYTYGINGDRFKEDVVAKKPQMVASEQVIFARQYEVEELVKGVLASEAAVTSIQNPFFQAFAKEVDAKQRVHPGGAQLNAEVALTIAKWKARGLAEAVLIRVRNECFSIPAPTVPPGA